MKQGTYNGVKTKMEEETPIYQGADYTIHNYRPKQSLFPSANNISSGRSTTETNQAHKDLGWLENKSFTAATAQKFVEFQEEYRQLQAGERVDPEETAHTGAVSSGSTPFANVLRVCGQSEANHDNQNIKTSEVKSKGLTPTENVHTLHVKSSPSDSDSSSEEVQLNHNKHKHSVDNGHSYDKRSRHKYSEKNSDARRSDHRDSKRKKKYEYASDSEGSSRSRKKKKKKHRYSSESEGSDYSHRHKKKKKKHHKKESRRKGKDVQAKAPEKKLQLPISKKTFIEEFGDMAPSDAFRVDRASDPNSWTYGSLYKLHVPNYRCYFHGCLGNRFLGTDGGSSKKKQKTHSNRYYGKENRVFVSRAAEEHLVCDKTGCVKMSTESHGGVNLSSGSAGAGTSGLPCYMEVESRDTKGGTAETDVRQQILDQSTSLYVHGKGTGPGEVEMTEEDKPRNPVLLRVAEYNRKLRESPHDVPLWLEFVKFQDTLIEHSDIGGSAVKLSENDTKRHTTAAIEKKLSIIDKACESNPGNLDLILARLELCKDVWDGARVSQELDSLLFVHAADTRLWRHRLLFQQSRMAVFSVAKVTKLYHKCFRTLVTVMEGKMQVRSVPENLAEDVTGIFVQYCYFLKQAGHREKCLATLQAMLEYNLFCPPELASATRETKIAAFKKFWDSSVPKLGAKGAKGWRAWDGGQHEPEDTASDREDELEDLEQAIIDKVGQKFETWLEIETLREGHHWFSWQPDVSKGEDVEDCEDMERLVLADDVSPALFTVPPHLHTDMVICFLDILDLQQDSRVKLKGNLLLENTNEIKSLGVGISCGKSEEKWQKSVREFAVNLLKQVIAVCQSSEKLKFTLAMIDIQLQHFYDQKTKLSKSDKKEMRKVVKTVLKEEENRNNLFVWLAYIELECGIGKPGEARTVVETALAMYSGCSAKSPPPQSEQSCSKLQDCSDSGGGLLSLCAKYCEILLNMREKSPGAIWERSSPASTEIKNKVASVIHRLIEGKKINVESLEPLSSTDTLKVSTKLSKLLDTVCTELTSSVEGSQYETLETKMRGVCWCYCLFTYCIKDLTAALSVLEKVLSVIQVRRDSDKCNFTRDSDKVADLGRVLLTLQLKLILYHMSTSSASLHILREKLDQALALYPDEATFVSLFIDVERKSRISGRFNRFFDAQSRSEASPVVLALAVSIQLKYLQDLSALGTTGVSDEAASVSSSALVHRTRRWLERCLARPHLQHCPLLWHLYLQLERQVGNMARVKGIFYRAIQQCPWVKSLYKVYIESAGDQLQELVDLMVEKELRVQIPVEELDILLSP